MGSITFNITAGAPSFHVELIPDIGTTWDYGATGTYTIYDIPDDTYCLRITDDTGCIFEECDIVVSCATTTTTTAGPTTTTTTCADCTTTTTTLGPTTTTTTSAPTTTTTTEGPCVLPPDYTVESSLFGYIDWGIVEDFTYSQEEACNALYLYSLGYTLIEKFNGVSKYWGFGDYWRVGDFVFNVDTCELIPTGYYIVHLPGQPYQVIYIESGVIISYITCPTTTTTTLNCDLAITVIDTSCDPTTTTTTCIDCPTTTTTTILPPDCIMGFMIETLYIDKTHDLNSLVSTGFYDLPSDPDDLNRLYDSIGVHSCSRALYSVFGNDIYIGDSRLNNSGGGATSNITPDGNVCGVDYHNREVPIGSGTYTLTTLGRRDLIVITASEAMQISSVSPSKSITFDFRSYWPDTMCANHTWVSWVIIRDKLGVILYSGVPDGPFVTLDLTCDTAPTYPGYYYRMYRPCMDDYCYINMGDKALQEGLLGEFLVGDLFYKDGVVAYYNICQWESVIESFIVLPPTCIAVTLTRTEDTCD